MAIKAIAMDIDGTLTNDQKVISSRTREKLLAAQESGIKLILASGRPAWGLHALGLYRRACVRRSDRRGAARSGYA